MDFDEFFIRMILVLCWVGCAGMIVFLLWSLYTL